MKNDLILEVAPKREGYLVRTYGCLLRGGISQRTRLSSWVNPSEAKKGIVGGCLWGLGQVGLGKPKPLGGGTVYYPPSERRAHLFIYTGGQERLLPGPLDG